MQSLLHRQVSIVAKLCYTGSKLLCIEQETSLSTQTERNAYIFLSSAFVAVSAMYYIYILRSNVGVCVVGEFSASQQSTFQVLDGIVNLGMTLSTGIVGLGAAMLVGTYGAIKLTKFIVFMSFISIASLATSVLYGIWWKMNIANIWFNECPNLIASTYIQDINSAHFYYMIVGVLAIGIIVAAASWGRIGEQGRI
jgi:hypothetical protein